MTEEEATYSYESSHSIHYDVNELGLLGGGISSGIGFTIAWEDPRFLVEDARIGAVEVEVIDAVIDRLQMYQHDSDYKMNPAFQTAIFHLQEAIDTLENKEAIAETAKLEVLEKAWEKDEVAEGREDR
ncbi:hypothetical protein VZG28_05265 [Synechococcus elongatus IITB4]|uniref:hypothetical protein n=1 Tax=Synechococcus elongatus TaxID=32046 RepID=UPI0030D4CEAC